MLLILSDVKIVIWYTLWLWHDYNIIVHTTNTISFADAYPFILYSLFFTFSCTLTALSFFLRCLSLLHFLFTLLKCYMALYAPNVHRFAFGINLKGGKRTIYSYMCFWGMQKVNWSISIAVSAHFVWLNQNDCLLKLQSLLAQFSFNMEFLSHFYLPHGQ